MKFTAVTSGILLCILVETVLYATVTAANVSSLKQRVDTLEKLVTRKINNLENELAQKTNGSENLEQKVNSLEAKIVEIQRQLEYGGRNYQRLPHRGKFNGSMKLNDISDSIVLKRLSLHNTLCY